MRKLWSIVVLALCPVPPSALAAQAALARPVIETLPNGVTRVTNRGPTRWIDTNGWKLVYERTVQPAEGAPGALETPWGAALASDGRLLTLDVKNPAIRLYDPNGKFLRALGRAGEGPGEYRVPSMALFEDSLFIYDPPLRRVTVMTLDGKVARTVVTTANDYFPIYFDGRGRMAIRYSKSVANGREGRWVYLTRAGVPVDSVTAPRNIEQKEWTYQSSEGPMGYTVPFPRRTVMLLLQDGTAVFGNTDRYTLVITRTGTDTLRVFGRTGAPQIRIPAATRDSAFQAEVKRQPRIQAVAKLSDLPVTYPLWRTLQTDGSGNIWVGAPVDRAEHSRFDVFTADGVFLGTVPAPFRATATIGFHGDRVTVIDTDADDLPRIRIYRIEKRGR